MTFVIWLTLFRGFKVSTILYSVPYTLKLLYLFFKYIFKIMFMKNNSPMHMSAEFGSKSKYRALIKNIVRSIR